MLMNVIDPEEIRVAIVGPGGLDEVYLERSGQGFVHGNIYKGRVENIEPTLQAAFIDIGGEKNGFLHVTDVVPPFGGYDGILKRRRKKTPENTHNMKIEDMLTKGQELLVQITREPVSHKGPSLTTFLSLPGRYLVMMPAVAKRGVSRKIEDDAERASLKKSLDELDPPKDMGFIIRTAGIGRGKEELSHDLSYMLRLWDSIVAQTKKAKPPAAIYRESDLVIRSVRDYMYDDIEEVVIDNQAEFERASEFLREMMPGSEDKAVLYQDTTPLFHKYGIAQEMENLFRRKVNLPGGGSIVVEQTEAMVTIDVNTGSFRKNDSSRDTILQTNKEAAVEIARQLRMRDLGGMIMLDFIDMETAADRRAVEDCFREALRRDRARITTYPIGPLGIMEMTRQRLRKSLRGALFEPCPACGGTGMRRSADTTSLEFVRRVKTMAEEGEAQIVARLHPDLLVEISNRRRRELSDVESAKNVRVTLVPDNKLALDEMALERHASPIAPAVPSAPDPVAVPKFVPKTEPKAEPRQEQKRERRPDHKRQPRPEGKPEGERDPEPVPMVSEASGEQNVPVSQVAADPVSNALPPSPSAAEALPDEEQAPEQNTPEDASKPVKRSRRSRRGRSRSRPKKEEGGAS